ncbi:GyrI-like domain-containing protein [Paludibaculum fermentans]|uniref:GyrI-like domain-containing protein n=1 Tax=Paludibaculum fermentans TaxID=1473598 RepID=A0A7S7SLY9_PALFE|nr:GyrI-like domain-containing protein [Paludibaculum fermentans]QOY88956.1 GyrI-like domain-containing protein [Paludibaculum fermentans]
MPEPTLLTLAPQPALVIRATTAPDQIAAVLHRCLPAVWQCAVARGATISGAPFTRYLQFDEQGLMEIEVGMPVLEAVEGQDPVQAVELPGGPCATLVHEGVYERLPATHMALDEWLESKGRQPAGPRWESYVTDPGNTPDPSDWRTLLAQPLVPE